MFTRTRSFDEEKKMIFIPAVAVKIKRNEISMKIKESSNQPIPEYLKRVKQIETEPSSSLMIRRIGRMENNESECIEVLVPGFEPLTEEQFEDAKREWPCYFYNHKEKQIEDRNIMAKSLILLNNLEEKVTGDFSSSKILEFKDSTFMLKKKIQEYLNSTIINIPKPLNEHYESTHSKLIQIGCSAICMIYDEDNLLVSSYDHEPIIGHAVTESIRRVSQSEYGYLCTGFTAFLFKEPCTSCAMAMVHGRIKNVFILYSGNECPFSKYKLNYNKDLNHRFNVYFYSDVQ